jgi:hypothetical protein
MHAKERNPMIGDYPDETIERCVSALQWLTTADRGISDALGGEPGDDMMTGRFFLVQCCLSALDSARQTIESSRMKVAA